MCCVIFEQKQMRCLLFSSVILEKCSLLTMLWYLDSGPDVTFNYVIFSVDQNMINVQSWIQQEVFCFSVLVLSADILSFCHACKCKATWIFLTRVSHLKFWHHFASLTVSLCKWLCHQIWLVLLFVWVILIWLSVWFNWRLRWRRRRVRFAKHSTLCFCACMTTEVTGFSDSAQMHRG